MKMYGLAFTNLLTFLFLLFFFCFRILEFKVPRTTDEGKSHPNKAKKGGWKLFTAGYWRKWLWYLGALLNFKIQLNSPKLLLPKFPFAKCCFLSHAGNSSLYKDAGTGVIAQLGLILTIDVWIPGKPVLGVGLRRINNSMSFSAM